MILSFVWTLALATVLLLLIHQTRVFHRELAKTEAVANFNKDVAFRIWAAGHGGAYVPVTEKTPPNPYLSHVPYRDITSPDGKKLTLMNPAYMLRQMMQKYSELYGVKGHITSLKHYRAETAPDEWEKAALTAFENGQKEKFEMSKIDGALYLRLMRPLVTKNSCLKCHSKQGYRVGDIRGGVSVSVPMSTYIKHEKAQIQGMAISLGFVWLMGLLGIGFLSFNLQKRSEERNRAHEKLQRAHNEMENRVRERTAQLMDSNEKLTEQMDACRLAEERSLESQASLQSFIDMIPQALFMTDTAGTVLITNNATLERVKLNAQHQLLGKCIYDFLPSGVAERRRQYIQEVLQTGKSVRVDDVHGDRHIESNIQPLFDESGKISRLAIMAIDITERKTAEKALLAQKEKAERYLNLASVMFIGLDPHGKINVANKKACRVLEYNTEEIMGRDWFETFIPQNIRHEVRSVFNELIAGNVASVEYYENEVFSKSGKIKKIAWHNTDIRDDNGNIMGILGSGEDLTEKRALEMALRQAQKMESIGNLAGGIAHEFNNVLAIILGNAELAMDDVPDWNPAKEPLKEIRTASFRAKDVVRQILSFARKTMTSLKPLEINTIVKESLKLMRASIPAMVDVQSNIPSAPCMILGDPTEIHQIVINLCTNAAHAMKASGGRIDVAISEVTLDKKTASRYEDLSPGDFVKLTVQDSGEGISPDILEKVFEPYFTTKEFGAGSGMGLAVVHGLVKKCKGAINIQSTVGEGTTVEVLFPKIEEELPAEKKKEDELPTGNERILLVDDDPSIVNMIRQMLEGLGYTVTSMTDSTAAIEKFKSTTDDFDLVITDMAMPKMSGDQLAAELIKVRRNIPILLCTGHSDTIDEKKAKQIGVKGFAMKPLDKGKLARAVRAVLDG